ncbi:MAG: hypothetical protein PVG22_16550 [Chromatiales bacterium]|jgi:hypothetical protein
MSDSNNTNVGDCSDRPDRTHEAEKARILAEMIVQRALGDASYRTRLKAEPEKVLCESGLAVGPAEDVQREIVVDGIGLASECTVTCISTCWYTCILSLFAVPPGGDLVNPVRRK